MMKRLGSLLATRDTLRPTLLVTWAVPAERVRPRVPAPLRLDTIRGVDGSELALLSVAAVRNVDVGPTLLPALKTSFDQANFRTYVSYEGRAGVYFFGNFIASPVGLLPPLLLTGNVYFVRSRMVYRWQRREGKPTGWRARFEMDGRLGKLLLDARGDFKPVELELIGTASEAAHFITQRLDGYFAARRGRVGRLPVDHVEMEPWGGQVREIRADPWVRWGLLTPHEVLNPLAVWLQHEVAFSGAAPQLLAT